MQTLPTETDISRFSETADIETSSDEYARRFSGSIGEYFLRVQTKITLELLKPYSNATVLDIGGGHAQMAVPLVEHGYKVTVTGSADVCRERLDRFLPTDSFEYITCNMLNLPFEDNCFDVVLAFRLLPHVNQWQKFISEMCRVSRNVVIFDYPDIRSFNFLYRLLFGAKKALEGNTRPFRLFNRREILQVLGEQKFRQPILKPQFFAPMALHRISNSGTISKILEFFFRVVGMTNLFGSPVIIKATKLPTAFLKREGLKGI